MAAGSGSRARAAGGDALEDLDGDRLDLALHRERADVVPQVPGSGCVPDVVAHGDAALGCLRHKQRWFRPCPPAGRPRRRRTGPPPRDRRAVPPVRRRRAAKLGATSCSAWRAVWPDQPTLVDGDEIYTAGWAALCAQAGGSALPDAAADSTVWRRSGSTTFRSRATGSSRCCVLVKPRSCSLVAQRARRSVRCWTHIQNCRRWDRWAQSAWDRWQGSWGVALRDGPTGGPDRQRPPCDPGRPVGSSIDASNRRGWEIRGAQETATVPNTKRV